MTNFILNLLQISISMAAVIGILLLLVPVWQKRYSAKWRKLVWIIVAVRLLVPFSVEFPAVPVQMHVNMHEVVFLTTQPAPLDSAPVPAVPSQMETPSNVAVSTTINNVVPEITVEKAIMLDRGTLLFVFWLIGLFVFTMYHVVQYRRFYGKIMASVKPLEDSSELLHRAGYDLDLTGYPDVLLAGGIKSPMLIGFKKPAIVLPYKLYGENELVMILRHELTHYKHHDLWYKLILLCANALHWFNPMVWLMNRQAGRDLEQVCDEYVVKGQALEYRKAYSMTILNTMASQKGVALSTHLSKDAQNTKKRFAEILQPRQYKKGIAVLLAVLVLAVGASGCLQVGKVDEGVALYEQIAEYLPENAIHNPEVYEVQSTETSRYNTYLWTEDKYEVTEEEANEADMLTGYRGWERTNEETGEGIYYQYRRTLVIAVSKETGKIQTILYANNEDKPASVKPAEIGRNKEQRDAYVQEIAAKFIDGGEALTFTEGYTEADENGNIVSGYYVHGTEADAKQYIIALDYINGYLQLLYSVDNDALDADTTEIWKEYPIMLEGMEETVRLYRNREPGYYAMYTDNTIFHRVPQKIEIDGAFCDKYLRRVEESMIQSYMQISFVPDITVNEWIAKVETDSAYTVFAPQNNPLNSTLSFAWEATDAYKTFTNEPNRQWQEFAAFTGAYNVCYLTPYRDGVMIVQLSHPFGSEYAEGLGARMNQMIDTLVLGTE